MFSKFSSFQSFQTFQVPSACLTFRHFLLWTLYIIYKTAIQSTNLLYCLSIVLILCRINYAPVYLRHGELCPTAINQILSGHGGCNFMSAFIHISVIPKSSNFNTHRNKYWYFDMGDLGELLARCKVKHTTYNKDMGTYDNKS